MKELVEWSPAIAAFALSGAMYIFYVRERARMAREDAERKHRPAE